jgi:SAM-dependent methyltransferase
MSLRWDHIPFTTEDKIGRQAQIWQYYASLIWSLRDRIKIYTYEQMTSNTEWLLKDVCEYLGLNLPQKSKPLENLNSESRYPNIAEIREAVKQYCPISREFGYQYSDSSEDTYKPQEYWEDRGANYEVNTKDYNSNTEILILESIIEKNNLSDSAILEVGSGYGRIFQEVGRKCSNYTMCDFSNSMRRECKLRTNILPDHWNGLKLPYPDNSFDLVILFSVLLHVPDEQINNLFSEICRVVKDYVFITTYTGNLKTLAAHCFKHDYQKLFKENGLKVTFEKVINADLRTNFRTIWMVKKQPLLTKCESANLYDTTKS